MPKLSDIIEVIEKLAPPALASDWDNTGLQVGYPGAEVKSVLVALDPLAEVVEEAGQLGCGLVVAHHPLFFRAVKRLDLSGGQGAVVGAAIRAGVAVYSAHTSLDRIPDGVSAALAAKLGLKKTSVLEQAGGWPMGHGFGVAGELPKKTSALELAKALKKALGLGHARLIGEPGRAVKRVALCGGSGSELIGAAMACGADAYVTGDVKYHDALGAIELGMAVIDIGHFGSELPVVEHLAGLLRKAFKKAGLRLDVKTSGVQSEPWTLV
jgi:dinuclear metal center YbgI/SA1388 family protein